MKGIDSNNSQGSPQGPASFRHWWDGPLNQLKTKQIAWLTVPLIIMATVTEFVILATGWKYQQSVCVPRGMGVTFFGIGPIGATILAVELLKLPLAIWTASRAGFQKFFMIACGLPLICLLTFQLVKDMAVYEMGVALAPAEQMLKAGDAEEIKINQLNAQLAVIDQKKTDRDAKLADLAARKTKAETDFQEQLKHIDDQRTDAISLTDYQKKELADVNDRETVIIVQAENDAAKLKQTLADLRAQRDQEVAAASKWNAEQARLDNAYQAKLAQYENAKAAYLKAKTEYDNANVIKRQFLTEPVDPGVAPVPEVNTILKPTRLVELDEQIKAKQAELAAVDTQRRQRVAQVEDQADQLRKEFDTRSGDRRGDSDRKRDALLAAHTAATAKFVEEEKQIDGGYDTTAQGADGLRAQIDANRKEAETDYEARVTAIENTQVHRIATTVEIIRGLLLGKHPVSITLTPKERGDIYTDQISMVRIWVYPVLAFIVAFLPTLMVEIGFSTLFKPEAEEARQIRLGFLGRHLHTLYMRAGRQKILRAERRAQQAGGEFAVRNRELLAAKTSTEKALADREAELVSARESMNSAASAHFDELKRKDEEHEQQLKVQSQEWTAKMTNTVDSLNRAIAEKDELRDLQKSEVERQVQMRQNAWSDRFTQMRQELDDQRNAAETERLAMMQAQQKKLLEVTEDAKSQVVQARRQAAAAELAATEATAKLTQDLKEAMAARDNAEEQLKQQAETSSLRTSQARDEVGREYEKALRTEKHRAERLQMEFSKSLRQREEDFAHKIQQREQELTLAFEGRLADEQLKIEEAARRSQAEVERQLAARAQEVDSRWKQDIQQREEAAQIRLRQREHQLQSQAEVRIVEAQTAAQQELQRRESDWQHQTDTQVREADNRWSHEMQQKELAYQTRLKQRENELTAQMNALAEGRLTSARAEWFVEAEKKVQAAVEPVKAMLGRAERERDQAVHEAAESVRHAQQLEKKLTDVTSFLNGWRNGGGGGNGNGNGNGHGNGKSLVPVLAS